MFGQDKEQLWVMLIDSWNLLAKARGDALEYFREPSSRDWYVVLEIVSVHRAPQLRVHILKSEAQGNSLIQHMKSAPHDFHIAYLSRSHGPMVMGSRENFAYLDEEKWRDVLSKYGTTHPVPWTWRDD